MCECKEGTDFSENQCKITTPEGAVISVDSCLVCELKNLWSYGIHTVASCCGHNKVDGIISVEEQDVQKMKKLGYKQYKHLDYMNVDNSFYPKSIERIKKTNMAKRLMKMLLKVFLFLVFIVITPFHWLGYAFEMFHWYYDPYDYKEYWTKSVKRFINIIK